MHKINLLASESDMCYRKSLCYMCHVMYISRMAIPAVSSWELFCLTLRFVTVMLELNTFLWCLWAVTLSFWDLIIWVLRKLIWSMSLVISTPYLLVPTSCNRWRLCFCRCLPWSLEQYACRRHSSRSFPVFKQHLKHHLFPLSFPCSDFVTTYIEPLYLLVSAAYDSLHLSFLHYVTLPSVYLRVHVV